MMQKYATHGIIEESAEDAYDDFGYSDSTAL